MTFCGCLTVTPQDVPEAPLTHHYVKGWLTSVAVKQTAALCYVLCRSLPNANALGNRRGKSLPRGWLALTRRRILRISEERRLGDHVPFASNGKNDTGRSALFHELAAQF